MEKFGKKIVSMLVAFCIQATKTVLVVPRGACRFYPSCSEFAREAIEELPTHQAIFCIVKRLMKCHPFARGAGYDPVPRITERRHCCE